MHGLFYRTINFISSTWRRKALRLYRPRKTQIRQPNYPYLEILEMHGLFYRTINFISSTWRRKALRLYRPRKTLIRQPNYPHLEILEMHGLFHRTINFISSTWRRKTGPEETQCLASHALIRTTAVPLSSAVPDKDWLLFPSGNLGLQVGNLPGHW